MAAEINELFEEGITRSLELTDAAGRAVSAIDRMAEEPEQRVQDEGSEALAALGRVRELLSSYSFVAV